MRRLLNRLLIVLAPALCCAGTSAPGSGALSIRSGEIVVAKDGSGDFSTVQEALAAAPVDGAERTVILVKDGVYREKVVCPANRTNITLKGVGRDRVVITYDDYARRIVGAETLTTYTSYTFWIRADGFRAENITFENSAGRVGQAVAVMVDADRVEFVNCLLRGNQDTFYTKGTGRCYLRECQIEGTTDFIFGSSIAVFDRCSILSLKDSYITAASTPAGNKFGYVFFNCRLTASDSVTRVYLGRPWRPHARTVFVNCWLDGHILPEGWHNWSKPDAEETVFYAEHGSSGPGANVTGRVRWSRQLEPSEAGQYTVENIFRADSRSAPFSSDWMPEVR